MYAFFCGIANKWIANSFISIKVDTMMIKDMYGVILREKLEILVLNVMTVTVSL